MSENGKPEGLHYTGRPEGPHYIGTFARWRARLAEAIARRRVTLGFVSGAVVFWFAQPTRQTVAAGVAIAFSGEALRFWAAGHLNKSREVTSSGPYRWFAHPLYVGSSIMGAGLAVASASMTATIVIALSLLVTLTAAVKKEEAFLRRAFGDRYEQYRRGDPEDIRRRFSFAQAIANREHRTVVGLLIAGLLLLLKVK